MRSQRNLLLAQVARLGMFLVLTRYLATRLNPADFGFFTLISTLFALTIELLDAGTTAAVTRQVAEHTASERGLLGLQNELAPIYDFLRCG